jgi:hypothetical protein
MLGLVLALMLDTMQLARPAAIDWRLVAFGLGAALLPVVAFALAPSVSATHRVFPLTREQLLTAFRLRPPVEARSSDSGQIVTAEDLLNSHRGRNDTVRVSEASPTSTERHGADETTEQATEEIASAQTEYARTLAASGDNGFREKPR